MHHRSFEILYPTNPMAMLTWLHSVDSTVDNAGLCHSVQGTTQKLVRIAGAPYEEVSHWVAGINHQAWVLELRCGGEDLYPALWEAAEHLKRFGPDFSGPLPERCAP
jgi:alpha-galactosidase